MKKKRAFTLTEILVVIVIIGALAALALPSFSKARDRAAANQAVAYLRLIRSGEKLYYAKNGLFLGSADTDAIGAQLGAEVRATGYSFAVTSPTADTFTATATRAGGGTITITQDGNIEGSGLPGYIDVPAN